ncbi:TatD family hydrolase [Aliiglaciecola litoralis]|uniref:Metal-dependent hydrolase n=1 Tax=Aliiglaciecola litoralis TaxID=582857 RepID=A0ABN1LJZ2_9ALTE
MIDSHCHLDFSAFDEDRLQVIEACGKANIQRIIIPGVSASQWPALISLCQSQSMLEFALGIHPYFIEMAEDEHLVQLQQLLCKHQDDVVAVGEIGLDFHLADNGLHQKQQHFFDCQLSVASEFKLPVILHQRQSHNEIIRMLKGHQFAYGGVLHAFSGSYQQAKTYVDMGFKLGIGGTITYPRGSKTRDVVKRLSLQHIVLETDAPDMPLHGRQGQRNSPLNLPEIAQQIALITNTSIQQVAAITDNNVASLFGLTMN